MIRKFSKRARGYMLAYIALESDVMKSDAKPTEITHKMIEKMKKVISSHHASLDFDKGFLEKVVCADGFNLVGEVKSENKTLGAGKRKMAKSVKLEKYFARKKIKSK